MAKIIQNYYTPNIKRKVIYDRFSLCKTEKIEQRNDYGFSDAC
jgi:hypothetical protein